MGLKKFLEPTKGKLKLYTLLMIADFIVFINMVIFTTCYGCSYSFGEFFMIKAVSNINILIMLSAGLFPYVLASIIGIFLSFFLFWYVISCCGIYLHGRLNKRPAVLVGIIIAVVLLIALPAYLSAQSDYQRQQEGYSLMKRMEFIDSFCVGGSEAVIRLRNPSARELTLGSGGDLTVMNNKTSGTDPGGEWYDLDNVTQLSSVEPGRVVRYNVSCEGLCNFWFVVGGRVMRTSVQC